MGDGFDKGGLALTVGTEHAYALARQHRAADAAQNHFVIGRNFGQRLATVQLVGVQHLAGGKVLQIPFWCYGRRGIGGAVAKAGIAHGQHGVGQLRGLKKIEMEVGAGQHRGELFHTLQGFNTALRLFGLGRFGFEAVDKLLQMGDFLLLAGVGRLLQYHLLGALLFKRGVVAAIAHQLAMFDMDGDLGNGIQKLTVVADDEQRAWVAAQPAFQPDQSIQVQVVGGFVQQ